MAEDLSLASRVLRRQLSAADYLASRGFDGLTALKEHVAMTSAREVDRSSSPLVALPAGWPRAIPLRGACMNGQLATLRYLVEEARVDVDLIDCATGDTGLHVAVAWGRAECVAWLLARGARHDVLDRDGLTIAGAARRRQALLERGDEDFAEKLRSKGMDIDGLREEGAGLCKMLDAVERAGSWRAFAVVATHRPRVQRAAPWLWASAARSSLAVLRALATREGRRTPTPRASTTKAPTKAAMKKRLAAAEAEAVKKATEGVRASDPPVEKALLEAGLVSQAPGEHTLVNPVFLRAIRWLDCACLDDLRGLAREDVARVDGPSSAERRQLWLFVCDVRGRLDAAVAEAKAAAAVRLEEDEARKRAASRPVDARAAVLFRRDLPLPCFARVAAFAFAFPLPRPPAPRPPAAVLDHLRGWLRAP